MSRTLGAINKFKEVPTVRIKRGGAPKGHPKWGGRRPGAPNKVTGFLKDAVLEAAAIVGQDGKGKDGLTGYLVRQAMFEPVAYLGLMGRIIPIQIANQINGTLQMVHGSMTQREAIEAYARALTANATQLIEAKVLEKEKEKVEEAVVVVDDENK